MNLWDVSILAIVQGITEFLPISSSGHLVLTEHLLNLQMENATLEIVLHFGTLLSIIWMFREKILHLFRSGIYEISKQPKNKPTLRYFAVLIVATIPAAFAGLVFRDWFENIFHSTTIVGAGLIFTGLLLLSSRFASDQSRNPGFFHGLIVGLSQVLAIFPGISRAGTTITIAMHLGVSRKESAEFSFFMAIPVLAGAAVLKIFSGGINQLPILDIAVGLTLSFIVGCFAISILLKMLSSQKFHYFAPYCIILGALILFDLVDIF